MLWKRNLIRVNYCAEIFEKKKFFVKQSYSVLNYFVVFYLIKKMKGKRRRRVGEREGERERKGGRKRKKERDE